MCDAVNIYTPEQLLWAETTAGIREKWDRNHEPAVMWEKDIGKPPSRPVSSWVIPCHLLTEGCGCGNWKSSIPLARHNARCYRCTLSVICCWRGSKLITHKMPCFAVLLFKQIPGKPRHSLFVPLPSSFTPLMSGDAIGKEGTLPANWAQFSTLQLCFQLSLGADTLTHWDQKPGVSKSKPALNNYRPKQPILIRRCKNWAERCFALNFMSPSCTL